MNHTISLHPPSRTTRSQAFSTAVSSGAVETLQSRFALRVAARLTENTDSIGADIGERLRFAREQALARARSVRTVTADLPVGRSSAGAAVLGRIGGGRGWWLKLASVLPVIALLGGLVMIQQWQDSAQISTAAEIDAALLSDALPPTAYSDAGFAEYLKTPSE